MEKVKPSVVPKETLLAAMTAADMMVEAKQQGWTTRKCWACGERLTIGEKTGHSILRCLAVRIRATILAPRVGRRRY